MHPVHRAILTSILVVVSAVSLRAQSIMAYTLELDGDNHAVEWKSGCTAPQFSGGDPSGGRCYYGDVITWSVRLAVSGVHSSGAIPRGAANMVVSLRLSKDGVDYPITADGPSGRWRSTINDGTARACPGEPADPLEMAAFPASWNVDATKPELYGRVIDGWTRGGPMGAVAYYNYPSAAGYPAGSTIPPGWLVGMGAGYASFQPSGCPTMCGTGAGTSTAGIGVMETTACAAALGTGPVFEGQIDTTGMQAGTYTLQVIPGTGNNILVVDNVSGGNCLTDPLPGGFALATDVSGGDTITFGFWCPEPVWRQVVNRQLFYAGSAWGMTPVPNMPGMPGHKVAKLPGTGPAIFENVSSYTRGINGLYIDLACITDCPEPLQVTAADFEFRDGNCMSTADWTPAHPPSISILPGQGSGGSDRVVLQWPNNAIPNKNWLQVRVKANANTGLWADDVFYFGGLVAETGVASFAPAARWVVNSTDWNECFAHRTLPPLPTEPITNPFDFNRDKVVNSSDWNPGYNARGAGPLDGLCVINP